MSTLTVMVVDDDAVSRDILGTMLRTQCQAVVEFSATGEEAMRKMREGTFDIVLLDLDMPGADGFATLEVIHNVRPDQYVVMVTANSTIEAVKKSIGMGANGFVAKPFTVGKIKDTVDKYLTTTGSA